MTGVFRRLVAAGSAALVPVGAMCALFVHAHLDDHDTPHHRGRQIHAHFSEHQTARIHHVGDRTSLDHDDIDNGADVQVFLAVSSDAQIVPALPATPFAVPTAGTRSPRPMRQVTHGHDPPLLLRLAPRPPPAYVL